MKRFSDFNNSNSDNFSNRNITENSHINMKKKVKKEDIQVSKKKIITNDTGIKNQNDVQSMTKEQVKFYGKIVKFPKNTLAKEAYSFLNENKISKEKLWYFMIEKNNELHIVKYNEDKGFKINEFILELLKSYKNSNFKQLSENIKIKGNENFVILTNIFENNSTKIKEDLIKLLSK